MNFLTVDYVKDIKEELGAIGKLEGIDGSLYVSKKSDFSSLLCSPISLGQPDTEDSPGAPLYLSMAMNLRRHATTYFKIVGSGNTVIMEPLAVHVNNYVDPWTWEQSNGVYVSGPTTLNLDESLLANEGVTWWWQGLSSVRHNLEFKYTTYDSANNIFHVDDWSDSHGVEVCLDNIEDSFYKIKCEIRQKVGSSVVTYLFNTPEITYEIMI